ncbi:MAG: NUDIX domain-containing protein [Hyphomicrobiaceae bacterium]|nr:NUDIX domain-containing protein [Hyphomicrobiaceae bacterium]
MTKPPGNLPPPPADIVIEAASAILFRDGLVLLVERGRGALSGLWSAPGGRCLEGETAASAARREVLEETGIDAEIIGALCVHEIAVAAPPTDTSDAAHGEARALAVQRFRIIVHYGRAGPGDPIPASDAANARFFEVADIEQLAVTPGLAAFVIEAGLRLDAMGEYRPMPRR